MVCLFFGKKTTVPEVDEILDWGLEPDPTLRPSATQLLEKAIGSGELDAPRVSAA